MQAATIRKRFIDFFEQRGHKHIAAAPIVNKEDPTLMFTNAGMNQFKDFFLGHQSPPYTRAVSAQPCLRVSGKHNDLEEVGVDTYHHTLFEMLGNWSFGDYFKKEAIQWAWELLTEVYKLPPDRLYVTIFGGDQLDQLGPDQEAQAIWQQYVPADRILLGNKADNFWEMGDTGPCGPCTEIHVDIRPEKERQQVPGHALVNQDHPQVVELWNLVFIQYNRLTTGQLEELPAKHVDTGMGLERLAMVLQAKTANYDTDLFLPLIQAISTAAGQAYGQTAPVDTAIRVIADHLRAVTFVIADGQPPANTGAGYVIRRILRRAVRYGYTYLGFETPFMYRLVSTLAQQLQSAYPHLREQQTYIEKRVQEEEAAFLKTLAVGLQRLDQMGQALQGTTPTLDGAIAFELYDTYGFPLDLTRLIAQERGWTIDEEGFAQALQAQRQRSKRAAIAEKGDWVTVVESVTPVFVGYDQLEATARIVKYRTIKAQGPEEFQVVLDQTPFYPEGGGQVGDTGKLVVGGESLKVLDTHKENDLIIHQVAQLPPTVTASVQAVVDRTRRALTANNHTATHLLHAALRQVLGTHVEQRGSLVNDRLLRFDFSHPSPLSAEEIAQVENLVNEKIRANIALQEQRDVPLATAKALGAVALFGEKYGEQVRVITFDPNFSVELCGGTHAPATGHLGFFKLTTTTAVAAGVRRIEAVTAVAAERWVHEQVAVLQSLRTLLKQPQDLEKAVQQLLQEKAILSKQLASHEATHTQTLTDQLRSQFQRKHGIHTLMARVELPQAAALKQVALALQKGKSPCFIVLAAQVASKPQIAVALSEDLAQSWPYNARDIVQQLAPAIQGGGGGKPTLATAGGKALDGLPRALELAEKLLTESNASITAM
ncbi:MAG: alanine--tRNA ligase [Bacteroidota bacterium]